MSTLMVLFKAKNYVEELDLIIRNKFEKLDTSKKLAIVNIGNNSASEMFIGIKKRVAAIYGLEVEVFQFKNSAKKTEVFEQIEAINQASIYGGLIIQYPFPAKFNYAELAEKIAPEKDVDFFNPLTYGQFALEAKHDFLPPTVKALDFIVNTFKLEAKGKIFTVLGQGKLVGKPSVIYSLNKEATVVSINEYTENIDLLLMQTDLLITASGVPASIKGTQLKRGACVIDFGSGNDENPGVGDFDLESDYDHLSVVSPSPGGVGPLTVRFLFLNFLDFVELQQR